MQRQDVLILTKNVQKLEQEGALLVLHEFQYEGVRLVVVLKNDLPSLILLANRESLRLQELNGWLLLLHEWHEKRALQVPLLVLNELEDEKPLVEVQ
jgi:hypothetical protein